MDSDPPAEPPTSKKETKGESFARPHPRGKDTPEFQNTIKQGVRLNFDDQSSSNVTTPMHPNKRARVNGSSSGINQLRVQPFMS